MAWCPAIKYSSILFELYNAWDYILICWDRKLRVYKFNFIISEVFLEAVDLDVSQGRNY